MNLFDPIDVATGLPAGHPALALRQQRDKAQSALWAAQHTVFDPALPDLGLPERLALAATVATHSGSARLAAAYQAQAKALGTPSADPRLPHWTAYAQTLALRPLDGDRPQLQGLLDGGLSPPGLIALAQLIGLVAFQARVAAGLAALATSGVLEAVATPTPAESAAKSAAEFTPFVHPAHLPKPGEVLNIGGYTSASLDWRAWLPVLRLDQASAHQIAVLKASHPTAHTSDYYLALVQQPAILEARSKAFNAILYAPGGLSRAERELASTGVSRVNGCVYCASVHAQRFEQLTKQNAVIAQVFESPEGAGTTPRERAIVAASIDLTRDPAGFSAQRCVDLAQQGLGPLEQLDLIHAVAIFAWANRLMLNLGEPVF